MKRKFFSIVGLVLICLSLTSCFKRDSLEGAQIYTTVYPIEYLTERLYGYNSDVRSIYPNGIDIKSYSLSNKLIKEYSNSAIFIYNGLSDEKEIAREFINANKKIEIIDVSYSLKYTYGIEELWLSPNNYLMLASNVKTSLDELIDSKYIKAEIQANFDVLEEDISLIDAELRSIGSSSKNDGKNNLLVASEVLQFLNNYGFETTLLRNENDMTSSLKNNLKNGKYKYIMITDTTEQTEYLKQIIENNKLEVITVKTLNVISDDDRKLNENYLTYMQKFLEQVKTVGLDNEKSTAKK